MYGFSGPHNRYSTFNTMQAKPLAWLNKTKLCIVVANFCRLIVLWDKVSLLKLIKIRPRIWKTHTPRVCVVSLSCYRYERTVYYIKRLVHSCKRGVVSLNYAKYSLSQLHE